MSTTTVVKPNTYIDSVSLMSISTKANQLPGVQQAFVAMGTPMNKEVLQGLDLITPEIEAANPGDLMLIAITDDGVDTDQTMADMEALLDRKPRGDDETEATYKTIDQAAEGRPDANLAVISVNGEYAAGQAHAALDRDMNVMIFSDNVSIEDELALKKKAHDKGLLLMGPDCGTAIIDGVGLCFANNVRRGNIGIVGASGTGSQEISVRVHGFNGGVSHLIGTGGRDLSEEIGGIMMLDGIAALEADPGTEVIVVISKPPAPSVAEKVIDALAAGNKPAVACFLGASAELLEKAQAKGVQAFNQTKPAAIAAVELAGVDTSELNLGALNWPLIEEVRGKLTDQQKYIRGIFAGGTLTDEAMFITMEHFDDVYSNLRTGEYHLGPEDKSKAHTFLDFGSDEYTVGKPHPMIDPSNRIERFLTEAADPETGVILLDFELGYGSNPDPVGVMLPAIKQAKADAEKAGRHLEILAYVQGTDQDPQGFADQVKMLTDAGVTWASSSTNTGLLAREFVKKGNN